MGLFEKQDKMAEEILTKHRGRVLAIVKATRAGATYSLLKKACELGQRTVIVAPYIKIFDVTVKEATSSLSANSPRVARIAANQDMCRKVEERIADNPSLEPLSFHLRPSCARCEYRNPESCRLQEILASEWDVLGLTYAKLEALSASVSRTASDLLEKVRLSDNLILDEFVTGVIKASPTVAIAEPLLYIDNESDLIVSGRSGMSLSDAEVRFREKVFELAVHLSSEGKKVCEGEHTIYDNPISQEDRFLQKQFC